MQKITKDTTLCISLAERPGNTGTIILNAAFAAKKIDFIYKAFRLKPGDMEAALNGIRAMGIRGCGISMPYKIEAVKYMDVMDPAAKKIGAINTIINNNGRLKGYNTDAYGAEKLLAPVKNLSRMSIVLLGAGGVARAICGALDRLGAHNVTIINRKPDSARQLAERWDFRVAKWGDQQKINADLFINATPIGMSPEPDRSPLSPSSISHYDIIMDVITNPAETKLMREAKRQGKRVLPGLTMTLHQGIRQFELYTGAEAPVAVMKKHLMQLSK